MDWFRWHTGSTTDPKFRLVARKAAQVVTGVRLSDVLAVWAMLLERACAADERGMIGGYDCESADAHLDLPEGAACAIVQVMKDKGLITDERVAKWDQRQPKREREDNSADRVRAYRERKKEEQRPNVTPGNDMEQGVTPCNAMKRCETVRGEEIRGEETQEEVSGSSNPHSKTAPLASVSETARSPSLAPTAAIIAAYHAILPERPRVRAPNKKLLCQIQARWREDKERQSLPWWDAFFREVQSMPWLMGQGNWSGCNLHWLTGAENMGKVLNGLYRTKPRDNFRSVGMLTRQGERNFQAAREWATEGV